MSSSFSPPRGKVLTGVNLLTAVGERVLTVLGVKHTTVHTSSPTSSGSGHDNPTARARFSTSCTVEGAQPHECAVLTWLTPIACNLRISLYLTILFPFSRWPRDALRVSAVDSRKEKPSGARPIKLHRCAPTSYGATHRQRVESCTDWCAVFSIPQRFRFEASPNS